MPEFTTEANLRLLTQIEDTNIASAELIAAAIAEAHERVLADLQDTIDLESPPTAVVQGETLYAAAILLRALASRDAVDQVELQIGGQRIDAGQKFASLMSMARRFEKEAMAQLAPYAPQPAAASPAEPTTTTPILGD